MSGWTDQNVIAQMELIIKPSTTDCDWIKAFEICDLFEASANTHDRVYGRAIRPLLVLTKEMHDAGSAGRIEESANILFGIIMALAVCYGSLIEMGDERMARAMKQQFEQYYNDTIAVRKDARGGKK